ncbi:hypothetical protein EHS25_006845 [Saitozyma podzolica]|uniref:3-hydroxyisobutyrate dehydrogenase n=1 Tax=Saitozyma podzolica TaxID=1890683 RepID=A0A427XRQ8_9TREE|nr:hypothetical protein EHS25_006845 [Saitozyma podzolica]
MSATSVPRPSVGWIGLGAMGSGMATSLVSQGFSVKAFDVWQPSVQAAVKGGAVGCTLPKEAATGVQVLGLMVVNAAQVDDVLFGAGEVAEVPPSFLVTVQQRLDALGKGIGVCDSPVSGGSTRAAQGQLTVMTSGTAKAIETARPVLDALTRQPDGKLSVVGSVVGAASDFKLINQVFCAVQIALASESMAFSAAMGLNPRMTYNLIRTAAGDSFMYVGIVMDEARMLRFLAPLSAAAEQLFTAATGAGMARIDDCFLIRLWKNFGVNIQEETGTAEEESARAKELDVKPVGTPKVLFVGLGAMGAGMAASILKAGIDVVGYDVRPEATARFGGKTTNDPVSAAKGASIAVLVPVTAAQAEDILFAGGVAAAMPENGVIVLCSTIAPSAALKIQASLDKLQRGLKLIDAPVSGGPSRANIGDLAVMASGDDTALAKACSVLQAMATQAGNAVNLHFIPGGVGFGSKMKAVNQLLAGVQLAVAGEALAFARKKGMDLDAVYDVVSSGAASSYVMKDRVPRMRMANAPVFSVTDTFVKDLGIVLSEAKALSVPLWLTSAAHQQFIDAAASGWGQEDDSCVGRLWERYGVRIRDEQ